MKLAGQQNLLALFFPRLGFQMFDFFGQLAKNVGHFWMARFGQVFFGPTFWNAYPHPNPDFRAPTPFLGFFDFLTFLMRFSIFSFFLNIRFSFINFQFFLIFWNFLSKQIIFLENFRWYYNFFRKFVCFLKSRFFRKNHCFFKILFFSEIKKKNSEFNEFRV